MPSHMQNPGLAPRASRNQLGRWLHPSLTATDRQAQLLASRFLLSPPLARDVARLCYGEACND
jgi:hypothetical protein